MSQDNTAPNTPARVRKIFRKGSVFICGLCGSSYPSQEEARACLSRCTPQHLANNVAEQAPKRFRCSFCKRVYPDLDQAKDCSRECRKKIEARMEKEQGALRSMSREEKLQALMRFANDSNAAAALQQMVTQEQIAKKAPKPAGMLSGENVKFQREKHLFRCLRCKQRYSSHQDVLACWDMHADGYKKTEAVVHRDDTHKYSRDGAKYLCKKCRKASYSADEAAACFDGHPEDFVREKPQAQADDDESSDFPGTEDTPEKSNKKSDAAAFFRDGAKYVCRGCGKKYFAKEEVLACFGGHEAGAEVDGEAKAKDTPQREDKEMFSRDGAKYVCKSCRAKYFTRAEVITCFESHS